MYDIEIYETKSGKSEIKEYIKSLQKAKVKTVELNLTK